MKSQLERDWTPPKPLPPSPCVGVCELKDNVCIGCNRTIEEITNWVPTS